MSATEDKLGAALRDYALDQLAHIDLQLARAGAWQHEGVHLSRKALARLRACVELLRKSPIASRSLERRLRSFAHGLSPLRDTQAALATAKRLRDKNDELQETWRELTRDLRQRRDRALGAALADDPGFATHRAQLGELRAALGMLAWTRLLPSELQGALGRADKRVRRAHDPARTARTQEPRHRLRRRSRRLLLQIRLLHEITRDASRPQATKTARSALRHEFGKSLQRKRRKHVIDKLGWEQDLRVLRRSLPARATTKSARRAIAILRRELDDALRATNKLLD